ncbi:MAG: radical SAM family heme chaperone HemW [Nitrospira sp.]|nr:radical SAM family heme chaperone HemW [Nitrospira sp.]
MGVYIHVPFCRQRCRFCAFYLEIAKPDQIDAFCLALAQEIALHRQNQITQHPLQSVYIGGGTPTVLPVSQLVSILQLVQISWPTEPSLEITIETHPSTVRPSDLDRLVEAGFNRLSVGIESLNQQELASLGRPGRVRDAKQVMRAARAAGFHNINLDLMYGLPGQTLQSWTETVQSALELEPTHLSCYALTVEEGTELARDVARHLIPPPDEALQIEMEMAAETIVQAAGFERYEISNYALPGFACRHNLLYWTDGDYLGLGPSAQSYVDGFRFGNVADLSAYITALAAGYLPLEERVKLTTDERNREALIFGLRLAKGVPHRLIHPNTSQYRTLQLLATKGLIEWQDDYVCLTPLGRRYADTVMETLYLALP